jgi:hydroxymethylpyrimidine/phosphomethylpyrimidine kinase
MRLNGRVLTIAGSDSGGGAGIQADIKTITALGAYAETAITAITVQDTLRVHSVHPLPTEQIAAQLACVLADPGVDAVKTGLLPDAAAIDAIAIILLEQGSGIPLVLDPVAVATSGDRLVSDDALNAIRRLFARATIITPNRAEAERLTGRPIATLDDARAAAAALRDQGATAVLLKGGHTDGAETLTDLLLTDQGETLFTHPRQNTVHTHGTGCTLSAAIATGLAQQLSLLDSVARAIAYVQQAIAEAPAIGAGHGPLNHAITVHSFTLQ